MEPTISSDEECWLSEWDGQSVEWLIDLLKPRARRKQSRRISERKVRLFACACLRRIWDHLPMPELRHWVEVEERRLDGLATESQMLIHGAGLLSLCDEDGSLRRLGEFLPYQQRACQAVVSAAGSGFDVVVVADYAARAVELASSRRSWSMREKGQRWDQDRAWRQEDAAQCTLLRDIVGNPFGPPLTVDAEELRRNGGVALRMAKVIYDDRTFGDMPILADALEESGCDDPRVLDHLRGPGPHVHGCHVLAVLLGKE
jgi:hypothetical protein